jgi:hypothetical protein
MSPEPEGSRQGRTAVSSPDNAFIYRRSRAFADVLAEHYARHILIPPFTPRWNGKVERFIQTLEQEWAKSRTWPNHHARDRALTSFLRYYNRRRPHTSLGDRPPISRVHHVWGRTASGRRGSGRGPPRPAQSSRPTRCRA